MTAAVSPEPEPTPWPPLERRPDVRELAFAALDDLPDRHIIDWVRFEQVRVRDLRASLLAGFTAPERVLEVLRERRMLRPGFGDHR